MILEFIRAHATDILVGGAIVGLTCSFAARVGARVWPGSKAVRILAALGDLLPANLFGALASIQGAPPKAMPPPTEAEAAVVEANTPDPKA